MRRTLLQIFVDYENLARTINLLTEAGVRDFCCVEYWRASAQDWPGFLIKEDPEMVVQAIKDNAERAVQVSTVVNGDHTDTICHAVSVGLEGKRATIMTLPFDSVRITSPYGEALLNKHPSNDTSRPLTRSLAR
ncbi:MAG: MJ1244 family protein [Halobacteriota archaeon]